MEAPFGRLSSSLVDAGRAGVPPPSERPPTSAPAPAAHRIASKSPLIWNGDTHVEARHQAQGHEALEAAQRATDEQRGLADVPGEALATLLVTLGEARSAAALWAEAVAALDEALGLYGTSTFVSNEIVALRPRGIAHRELGDDASARHGWGRAPDRLDEIGAGGVPDASREEPAALLHGLVT